MAVYTDILIRNFNLIYRTLNLFIDLHILGGI